MVSQTQFSIQLFIHLRHEETMAITFFFLSSPAKQFSSGVKFNQVEVTQLVDHVLHSDCHKNMFENCRGERLDWMNERETKKYMKRSKVRNYQRVSFSTCRRRIRRTNKAKPNSKCTTTTTSAAATTRIAFFLSF